MRKKVLRARVGLMVWLHDHSAFYRRYREWKSRNKPPIQVATFPIEDAQERKMRIAREAAAAMVLGLPVKRVSLERGVEYEEEA